MKDEYISLLTEAFASFEELYQKGRITTDDDMFHEFVRQVAFKLLAIKKEGE